MKLDNMSDLVLALDCLSVLSLTKSLNTDSNALCIWIPVNRLIVEILLAISYIAVVNKSEILNRKEDTDSLNVLIESLRKLPQTNIMSRYVCELSSCLKAIIVPVAKKAMIACGQIVLGAGLSFAAMSPNAMLFKGLYNGAIATFDMFKKIKSGDQLTLMFELTYNPYLRLQSPPLNLKTEPLKYDQLVSISKMSKKFDGNWLLTSAYVNNLFKITYHAYQNILKGGKDQDPKDKVESMNESMKVAKACIMGDESVFGIGSIIRKINRKKPRDYKGKCKQLFGVVMNAGSMTDFLRSASIEATGELTESLQLFTKERFSVLQTSLAGDLLSKLNGIESIYSALLVFKDAVSQFDQSIAKTIYHTEGIIGSLEIVKSYCKLFLTPKDEQLRRNAALKVDSPVSEYETLFISEQLKGLNSEIDKMYVILEFSGAKLGEALKKLKNIHSKLFIAEMPFSKTIKSDMSNIKAYIDKHLNKKSNYFSGLIYNNANLETDTEKSLQNASEGVQKFLLTIEDKQSHRRRVW